MSFPFPNATPKTLLVSAKLLEGHLAGVQKQIAELLEGLTLMVNHDSIAHEEADRDRDKVTFNDLEDLPF